jgi:hypothetical protein
MLSTQPNPVLSAVAIGILNCSGCGKPMRLACIEPDKPGLTFECPKCNTDETFLIAI